jgi:hypothetical protein
MHFFEELACLVAWGILALTLHRTGDGYPLPKKRRLHTSPIKPKPKVAPQEAVVPPLLPHCTPNISETPHYALSKNRFRTQLEYRYFLTFRNDTVASLPSLFSRPLWEKVILQACDEEDFVSDNGPWNFWPAPLISSSCTLPKTENKSSSRPETFLKKQLLIPPFLRYAMQPSPLALYFRVVENSTNPLTARMQIRRQMSQHPLTALHSNTMGGR